MRARSPWPLTSGARTAGLLSKAAGCSVTALQVAERVCVKKVGAEARNAGVKSLDAQVLRELTVLTPSQLKA